MKKITSFLVVLFLGLQIFAQMGPLPIDPQMKKGVLDNGMTYYIRANQEPRGQAEFFIVQKVGSIEEEESQRGLAHFLEHMAFNGLKHFPDKDLFKFTEGIGVKFGYNLNAYTSFDRTVYNISAVPVSREGIIDSCLLVLYDWADGLTLEQKAIDEERGVIREEMRTRDNGFMRIYEKLGLQLMPNNIYSVRWPIGIESVIMHF
jgi:zinc protease